MLNGQTTDEGPLLERYGRCSWSAQALLKVLAEKLAAKNAGADLSTGVMIDVTVTEMVDGRIYVACAIQPEVRRAPPAPTRSSGRRPRLPPNVIAFPGRRT